MVLERLRARHSFGVQSTKFLLSFLFAIAPLTTPRKNMAKGAFSQICLVGLCESEIVSTSLGVEGALKGGGCFFDNYLDVEFA